MQIPFFRYTHVFEQHRKELLNAFLRIAQSGAFILQADSEAFEEELASFVGVKYAVGTGNGTDAIELVLRSLGIGSGDEIILPSHTFVASAAAVIHVGATPILAEVGEDHLLDPVDAESRITPRTKAIMPTQLNGRTAQMDQLLEVTARHGLLLLEDSAQGLGSRFRGRMAGTFAPAGVYSFYPAKTLGALGDAGAIVTDEAHLYERLRRLRDHGRDAHGGAINLWGRNSRLDNLQAAFLRVKLPYLNDEIEHRRRIAGIYDRGLRDLTELSLPPYADDGEHFDVFQNYELEAERRDELIEHLSARTIGTIRQWGGTAVHQFPDLLAHTSLPRTESIMARSFLLPMNTSLSDDEATYIVAAIREFYGFSPRCADVKGATAST